MVDSEIVPSEEKNSRKVALIEGAAKAHTFLHSSGMGECTMLRAEVMVPEVGCTMDSASTA